jgi:hypothetical protein
MAWTTDLFCSLTFSRQTFNYKSEVEEALEGEKECLNNAKNRLNQLAFMTEPGKFCPEETDPYYWIENEVKDCLLTIEDCSIAIYKLEMLLENWENCHNGEGLAIDPPEGFNWKTAFLSGDFVRSINRPDATSL